MSRRRRRPAARAVVRALVLCLLALVLTAGCQATADVHVRVRADGSGTVSVVVNVDADAAKRLPPAADLLAVDDLRNVGWRVEGPTIAADGSFTVLVQHNFANLAEANRLLASIGGSSGPVRGLHLERKSSLGSTTWQLTGSVDLSKGADAFGDPALTAALGNRPVSALAVGLVRPGDPPLADAVRLTVSAQLPGSARSLRSPPTGLGDPVRSVHLRTHQDHGEALWFLLGAVLAALLVVMSLWWAVRGWRKDRKGRNRKKGHHFRSGKAKKA